MEIFKLTIPALAVFFVSFYTLRQFLDNDYQKRLLELRRSTSQDLLPLKMQAYERLILYMERINPSNILVRLTHTGMSAQQLKTELIDSINEEFNHNLAQQLYVSPQAWKLIRIVKEQLINLINVSYKGLEANATGVDLSKAILDTIIRSEEIPTDKAIDFLKKEFKLMFD
jgi:hypothetical protein